MRRTSRLSALILLGSFFLAQGAQSNQNKNVDADVLQRQVTTDTILGRPVLTAFLESMVSARVPGGIVTINGCENTSSNRQTVISPGTLQEAMDTIIKNNPEYRWQIDGGVVNLLLVHVQPALLNVRITKLKVENARSIDAILDQLIELPEVKVVIAKQGLTSGMKIILGPVSTNPERQPKYTLECENMTLREVLNTIVRIHGHALWEYKEQRCDGKTVFNINFIAS